MPLKQINPSHPWKRFPRPKTVKIKNGVQKKTDRQNWPRGLHDPRNLSPPNLQGKQRGSPKPSKKKKINNRPHHTNSSGCSPQSTIQRSCKKTDGGGLWRRGLGGKQRGGGTGRKPTKKDRSQKINNKKTRGGGERDWAEPANHQHRGGDDQKATYRGGGKISRGGGVKRANLGGVKSRLGRKTNIVPPVKEDVTR